MGWGQARPSSPRSGQGQEQADTTSDVQHRRSAERRTAWSAEVRKPVAAKYQRSALPSLAQSDGGRRSNSSNRELEELAQDNAR